jgi:hypothetical protein
VPSFDPLSMTIASQGTEGGLRRRAVRHSRSWPFAFHVTITTETRGPLAGGPLIGEMLGGLVRRGQGCLELAGGARRECVVGSSVRAAVHEEEQGAQGDG